MTCLIDRLVVDYRSDKNALPPFSYNDLAEIIRAHQNPACWSESMTLEEMFAEMDAWDAEVESPIPREI